MLRHTWTIGRILGVEIRVDASWVLIALLVVFSFFETLRIRFPDLTAANAGLVATAGSAAFFGSVVVHELAHAAVARLRGKQVKSITLFLFGGATETELETGDPIDELMISIVGPLTSGAVAVVLWFVVVAGGELLPDPIAYMAGYLGWINGALAVFNLLPGFPLDGGRVLRATVWQRTGDLRKATRTAASAGQMVGFALVAVGISQVFLGYLGGLWLAAIGWFLSQAAIASYQATEMRLAITGIAAGQVMTTEIVSVPAGSTIAEAVDRYFMHYDHNAFPVAQGAEVIGLVTLPAVRSTERSRWTELHVEDIMTTLDEASVIAPGTPMERVLELLEDETAPGRVLVMEGSTLLGIVTPRDVSRWVRRSRELGASGAR